MAIYPLLAVGFMNFASIDVASEGASPVGISIASSDVDFAAFGQAQPNKGNGPKSPQGITVWKFSASEFPFVTTIPDDGTGKAGGWQVAKVNLEFIRIVVPTSMTKWYCPFKIQMPLRTEFMGKVDAQRAAKFSVEITNSVAAGMDRTLPEGIFCERFMLLTRATFKVTYPFLGATATK
jgi:hypothetical protein